MPQPTQREPVRNKQLTEIIVDAARTVVASRGLAGMSLRAVADQADVSVGSISYRVGDRNALIAALLDREISLAADLASDMHEIAGGIDPVAADSLADLVGSYFDLLAGRWRTSAIVVSELLLLVAHKPEALPGAMRLVHADRAMWGALLKGTEKDMALAHVIADYCADERPFAIALSDNVDYRLLRQSTVRALLRNVDERTDPARGRWHMMLVDRLAIPAAPALRPVDIAATGTKAIIANHIADAIMADGMGELSHRLIAQASGMAVSSIAHHFPTLHDLVLGGVESMYRAMRAAIRGEGPAMARRSPILRLTHECALLASRKPDFIPFAIDMRRRRAENVHETVAASIGLSAGEDRARTQAIVMAAMGGRMLGMAANEAERPSEQAYVQAARVERSFL